MQMYSVKHRHIAPELWNGTNTPQSKLTDTYSIGRGVKTVGGVGVKLDSVTNIGRKHKFQNPFKRPSLALRKTELKDLLYL